MNDRIFLTKKLDPLTKENWEFIVIGNNIYLDSYQLINYATTRKRNGGVVKWYSRLQHSINKYSLNLIKSDEVPLTDEIKKEVLEKYLSKLKVIRWEEK